MTDDRGSHTLSLQTRPHDAWVVAADTDTTTRARGMPRRVLPPSVRARTTKESSEIFLEIQGDFPKSHTLSTCLPRLHFSASMIAPSLAAASSSFPSPLTTT